MATYKEIHGVNIQSRDSDPTAVEGDVWYNASTSKLKMFAATGSWASGGDLNAARMFGVSVGTQTAGLVASGEVVCALKRLANNKAVNIKIDFFISLLFI